MAKITAKTIVVKITPATKPDNEEAIVVPILNLNSLGSYETKSLYKAFMFYFIFIKRPFCIK